MNDMTEMGKISVRQPQLREARLFVPMSDELLYEHPERISGPLIAYQPGHLCATWLSVELNPTDEPPIARKRHSGVSDNGAVVTDAADPSGRDRNCASAA